jgi:hypothetical protein
MLACIDPVNIVEDPTSAVGWKLDPPMTLEQEACCKSYVETLVNAGAAPPATTTIDDSLLNCCRAFAYTEVWETTVTHTTCCSGAVLSRQDANQPYCSPWGPPVPPALVLA